MSEVFGAVRSLMQEPPSEVVWSSLCGVLDEAPADAGLHEELGAYLGGHLARWPDPLRVAPQSWCAQALAGASPAWWSIVRAVHLMQPTNAMIKSLFKSVDVQQITSLTLENETPKRGAGRSKSGLVKELTKAGPLPQLRRLELRVGNFGDKSAELLAGAKNLTGLEELVLTSAQIEHSGYCALASSTTLPPLRAFNTNGSFVSAIGEAVQGPLFSGLESLSFDGWIRDDGLAALCAAPCAATLKRVRFYLGGVSPEAIAAAVDTPLFDGLEAVEFTGAGKLSGATLQAMMAKPFVQQLDTLRLDMAPTLEDIQAVCAAPMPALRTLRLSWGGDAKAQEGAFDALAANPCMAGLEVLALNADYIPTEALVSILCASTSLREASLLRSTAPGPGGLDDAALERVCAEADLSKLRVLKLDNHKIQGPGLAALSAAPRLRVLSLNKNPLTDEALAIIPLTTLERLNIAGDQELGDDGEWSCPFSFSPDAVQRLFAREAPALAWLDLGYRDVTDDGFMALMTAGARFPALRVVLFTSSPITDAGLLAQREALAAGTLDIPPALEKVSTTLCREVTEGYTWGQELGLAYF